VHNVFDGGRYITWGSGGRVGAGNLEYCGPRHLGPTEIKFVCSAFLRLYNYYFCLEEYQAQFWKLTAANNELLKQLAEKARLFTLASPIVA
jgi:hypothetical protein